MDVKSGPLESGEFDEMANNAKKQNLAIIRPGCNKLLIGAPSLVTNFANFSNYAAKDVLKRRTFNEKGESRKTTNR